MASEYDRYREALVVEVHTIWPEDLDEVSPAERRRVEQQLHSAPEKAAQLRYERLHTGFARIITVTADDLAHAK